MSVSQIKFRTLIQGESHADYDTAVSTCEDMDAYLFYAKTFPELNSFVSLRPQRNEWYGKFPPVFSPF